MELPILQQQHNEDRYREIRQSQSATIQTLSDLLIHLRQLKEEFRALVGVAQRAPDKR